MKLYTSTRHGLGNTMVRGVVPPCCFGGVKKKENMYIQSLLADAVRECSSVAEGCYGAAAAAHHEKTTGT